jgi:hypothetical protein
VLSSYKVDALYQGNMNRSNRLCDSVPLLRSISALVEVVLATQRTVGVFAQVMLQASTDLRHLSRDLVVAVEMSQRALPMPHVQPFTKYRY